MKRIYSIIQILVSSFVFSWVTIHSVGTAGTPVWTFSPDPDFPPSISLNPKQFGVIIYTVTNQSKRSHLLQMRRIKGITASGCATALGYKQSCVLTLVVDGSALSGSIIGGPILCDHRNPNQCYQPSQGDELEITLLPPGVFTVTAAGDSNVTASPTTQSVEFDQTGTINLTVSQGFTASIASDTCDGTLTGTTYVTGPVTEDCSVSFSSTIQQFTVTASGDSNVTASPTTQEVTFNQSGTINLTISPGYVVATVNDTCGAGGGFSGTTYFTSPVTDDCSVSFESEPFVAAAGPKEVTAVPDDGEVIVSWVAPTNIGVGTISGYTVTYGPTSGTTFTTAGCTATPPATSCTVTGLTNNTAYTFVVRATTTLNGSSQVGAPSYSSSVTPINSLAVSPSPLALSSLGGGESRTLTLINNSNSDMTLDSLPTSGGFSPALPTGTSLSSTTCTTTTPLTANGGSCTITITPGSTASSNSSAACTTGVAPISSALTVTANGGTITAVVNVLVLGYGCQYQGGYLFAIDDTVGCTTTPCSGSIGGQVVAAQDQSSQITWGPNNSNDSIWGISDASTTSQPDPNSTTPVGQSATFQTGQLNCTGKYDGSCNSYNIVLYPGYGNATNYAAGFCTQALDNTGVVCTGGSNCYADWYLPSICELGTANSAAGPTTDADCLVGTPSISTNLYAAGLVPNLLRPPFYFSSTEYTGAPADEVWVQYFESGNLSSQFVGGKSGAGDIIGVRCVRSLTL